MSKSVYFVSLIMILQIFFTDNIYAQSNDEIERKVDSLLATMTLEQKIGQTAMRGTSSRVKGPLKESLKKAVREGRVGAVLNVMKPEYVNELQKIAVEESPNKIPLLYSRDVIHGFKTIFPIPIGIAASWDEKVAENCARVSAIEASSMGIRWTFAPMIDIATDSRWGRVAESPGEDPFLASIMAKAYVKGFHGKGLKDPTSMAACAKHMIGYGAAIGGRDYNTTIIHEPLLRNKYLPPFQAAVEAGAPTVMAAFNEINGIPASGNELILNTILRKELGFDGFVVSDWNSVIEMIPHGFAEDEKHAAQLAVNSGLDMEMTSQAYEKHLKELIKEGKVKEEQLDFLVKNILRIKYRLGVFENPYLDEKKELKFYQEEHLAMSKVAAIKSSVLLKNNNVLPLKKKTKIALIGPMADAPREQLGTWTFDGEGEHSISPLKAFKNNKANITFSTGLKYSRDKSEQGFEEAVKVAKSSDVILFVGGEEAILSGEAHSRANIDLPGAQEKLIKELAKTGKPIVLVIMAGRPITITNIIEDVDAVLMMWHPGTMGGDALFEMVYGENEPQGRLPITWPKTAGQMPLYYNHKNTGRPANKKDYVPMYDIPVGAWQSSLGNDSHYLDAGYLPHFPFGFGLSYTKFEYSELKLSKESIGQNEQLEISVMIENIGGKAGVEIPQLYIQDVVGSLTRPVKELKAFKKITLKKGEKQKVTFTISSKDLEFVNHKMEKKCEPGKFNVWVGSHSAQGLKGTFLVNE